MLLSLICVVREYIIFIILCCSKLVMSNNLITDGTFLICVVHELFI
jgi:hypothetical protein